jgi:hypothetical protein
MCGQEFGVRRREFGAAKSKAKFSKECSSRLPALYLFFTHSDKILQYKVLFFLINFGLFSHGRYYFFPTGS